MTKSRRIAILATLACSTFAASTLAQAADQTTVTLYRSDSASLYASDNSGDLDTGYAVIHEQRQLKLDAGVHDVALSDLPTHLDAEALALSFPQGQAKVISQRLLLAQGSSAALTGMVGREVTVLGSNGDSLAAGTLLRAGDGLLVKGMLGTTLVTQYAAVRTSGNHFSTGSSLRLRVDAKQAGEASAVLSYPTSGLGWRAAYSARMMPGDSCRMQFESRASIANRSGRDWNNIQLTLIAGEPNMAKASGPQPMMAMARHLSKVEDTPQQQTLADYRSYRLPDAVTLPDGSVSQVPLYATRTIDCQRTALDEDGNTYQPSQPMLARNFNQSSDGDIVSTLKFRAFDSLPAGYLRVLTNDSQGTAQFIGEGRINDTPKGADASITLGTAFDLHAQRTRTAFQVDEAGHSMNEAFRIVLSNTSDSARTITVRQHPDRWSQWVLASSSSKPSSKTTDTLEFQISVPANSKKTLDYAVRYQWTAQQSPQS